MSVQFVHRPGARRSAVWAFAALAMIAAAVAVWRAPASERQGAALAVSVPAASSPAAAAGSSPL